MDDWNLFSPMISSEEASRAQAEQQWKQEVESMRQQWEEEQKKPASWTPEIEFNTANATAPWFVNKTEYKPLQGTFEFLICGQRAFGEVYRAIAHARKSVSIICWGFQPSMYFMRGGGATSIDDVLTRLKAKSFMPIDNANAFLKNPLPIGELLRQKAKQGVDVRVLCWGMNPIDWNLPKFSGESNMPNKSKLPFRKGPNDRAAMNAAASKLQDQYDSAWFSKYGTQRKSLSSVTPIPTGLLGLAANKAEVFANELFDDTDTVKKLKFCSRGFSLSDHNDLRKKAFDDKEISKMARSLFSGAVTHHQKMVLVDYELDWAHVGFVMGHNMLDDYWDTEAHGYLPHPPERGRNGVFPREDLSSRVTGPIVGNLFKNFQQAWTKQTGESLAEPNFTRYPRNPVPLQEAQGSDPQDIFGHIIRTQSEYGVEDIKKTYLNALNNATECIYVENQYFRWNPFADKLKEVAANLTKGGRKPEGNPEEGHGSLYVFVVTNSSEEGMGAGAKKTLEMMDRLGRANTMPEAARQDRVDNLDKQIQKKERTYDVMVSARADSAYAGAVNENALAKLEKEIKALKEEREKMAGGETVIVEENIPGLKVNVCTLVPPNIGAGYTPHAKTLIAENYWDEVYVHSKLMIVDDIFMTLGSTNINTRSMQVDTELNLAHYQPNISKKARRDLWQIHTNKRTGNSDYENDDKHKDTFVKEAFKEWRDIIDENGKNEAAHGRPIASLRGFLRHSASLKNWD